MLEPTVDAGAEPVTVVAGAEPVVEPVVEPVKPGSEPVPWDKDPRWQEWRGAEQKLQAVLKANDVESLDELETLIGEGTELKGKMKDVGDIESLQEKADKLDGYEKYWAEQEELKQREDETDDEARKRLERELKVEKGKTSAKEKELGERESARKAVVDYEREIKVLLSEGGLEKGESGFMREFFGVGNPLNDLDITNTKAIKKMVDEGMKKKEAYDQAVIQKYVDGKTEIPQIPSGNTATPEIKEVKNLKEARAILKDRMSKFGK